MNTDDVAVLLACPSCAWSGTVTLYNIGDGPEWCCPSCDMCWPSKPVVGEDGLTAAERSLREFAAETLRQSEERWTTVRRSGIVTGDAERVEPEDPSPPV